MTFRFIDEHKDQWPIRLLCETLEVSPAGSYAWQQRPRSAHEQRQDALLVDIRAIYAQFKRRYGTSPYRFLLMRRLEHVRARLSSAEPPPLAALAAEAGFADQAHMGRVFKAAYGLPPRRFAAALSR